MKPVDLEIINGSLRLKTVMTDDKSAGEVSEQIKQLASLLDKTLGKKYSEFRFSQTKKGRHKPNPVSLIINRTAVVLQLEAETSKSIFNYSLETMSLKHNDAPVDQSFVADFSNRLDAISNQILSGTLSI
ncbi:MAG: hypothetical protein ACI9BD_000326, partial [Candidatus Marinamargulisbacteria bacterium]